LGLASRLAQLVMEGVKCRRVARSRSKPLTDLRMDFVGVALSPP
jgi:hypothetical protein